MNLGALTGVLIFALSTTGVGRLYRFLGGVNSQDRYE